MPNVAIATVETIASTALVVRRVLFLEAGTVAVGVYIKCDATAGAFALTIPLAANIDGRVLIIKKIDSTANAITVTRAGSDLIDGATTKLLSSQYDSISIVSDDVADSWDIWSSV